MTARLMIVGLDAADSNLVEYWIGEGSMPHLSQLKARGLMKRLTSPDGNSDDSLWASFQYGLTLPEHGRYHWCIPSQNNSLEMSYKNEVGLKPFWNNLIRNGLRKAIIDIPKCAEPQKLNGIHLADWLVHGKYFSQPTSFPPELAWEIVGRFGPALPSSCGYFQGPHDDFSVARITSNLCESIARKKAAGLHFLNTESWDLFLIGFKEAHCGCHSLWDLTDKHHVHYDEQRNFKLREPIKSIFSHLDNAIGELVNAAGTHAEVVVFSTTDMKPNGTLDHLLPKIIDNINQHLGEKFCSILPYNDNFGALRITASHMEKNRIAKRISQMLSDLIDVESKRYVIRKITFPSIESIGNRANLLPDVLVAYTPNLNPQAVESPLLGRIKGKVRNIRMGNHSEGGFLIAAGNKIQQLANDISALEDFAEVAAAILD
jgi:hypothetical protein